MCACAHHVWQEHGFVTAFMWGRSMALGDVNGCPVDKGWTVMVSFMCQLGEAIVPSYSIQH